jgi:hypothetical protein
MTQVNHEMRARAEDAGAGEGEEVPESEESDADDDEMDQVRQSIQLINTLSPEQENLDFICQQIGIPDWRNLRMSCMVPDAPAAKPRQIVGKSTFSCCPTSTYVHPHPNLVNTNEIPGA